MNISVLLKLALALLIAAQQPNVPQNLKIEAISTANIAISYAISSGLAPQSESLIPELTQNSSSTGVSFGDQATSTSKANINDCGCTFIKDL